jgi:hypothetical protein
MVRWNCLKKYSSKVMKLATRWKELSYLNVESHLPVWLLCLIVCEVSKSSQWKTRTVSSRLDNGQNRNKVICANKILWNSSDIFNASL